MSVPEWVSDAVFYQIFPDRFADGDPSNNPANAQPWGSAPKSWGFQGGDLQGIVEHLDYLQELGVNALYLNPIFYATSNHRYNTTDYFQIDPRLGGQAAFELLRDGLHAAGMKLILDGVFNHCGRGFFAFNDLLENERHSSYLDWFHVRSFPLHAYTPGEAHNYLGWWNLKSLPKFNTSNPQVREYLLRVARHWIEQGADGWRLDVPNEIDDDSFWQAFSQTVTAVNPQAYLVGEIWELDRRWVEEGHFHGLMNYPLRTMLLDALAGHKLTASQLLERMAGLASAYPLENALANLTLLGSHDTERIRTALGGSLKLLRLAYLLAFSFPGVPLIYYGDEIGLEGTKDPGSRGAFPWEPSRWESELREWIRTLISTRRRSLALRRGSFMPLQADDQSGLLAFGRQAERSAALAAVNLGGQTLKASIGLAGLALPPGQVLRGVDDQELPVTDGMARLQLGPWEGALYTAG
jgi:cyclomaltodextrinase